MKIKRHEYDEAMQLVLAFGEGQSNIKAEDMVALTKLILAYIKENTMSEHDYAIAKNILEQHANKQHQHFNSGTE